MRGRPKGLGRALISMWVSTYERWLVAGTDSYGVSEIRRSLIWDGTTEVLLRRGCCLQHGANGIIVISMRRPPLLACLL